MTPMKPLVSLVLAGLLLGAADAAAAALSPTAEARAQEPFTTLVPTPRRATFPAGVLPLSGLGVKVVGTAPELTWAARDLNTEWQTRLGLALGDAAKSGPAITVGTVADAELAAKAKAAGLDTTAAEGYALWVDASGAWIVGADAKGAYEGAQTLRQLLTPGGLRYARISDAPALKDRVAMIYLDQFSAQVNDRVIPLLAQLKFNAVLIMSDYVQWDTAKAGGYAHPGGASKAEARRVAELARSYGLEPIPLIETLSHAGWMFYGGKNLDLRQDEGSQNPWAYDTLNPATYGRVVLPILKEAVEVFRPQRLHIGHDELRSRDRFPARDNGKAVGLETLVVDDIVKLHDALKAQGVATMLWHDTAFADAVVATLPARLPKDIQVAYWNYTAGTSADMLGKIKGLGFPVLGASWLDAGNPEGMAKASVAAGAQGMIQTRWNGYFGNPSIWDGQADQGVPFVRAGSAFWNPDGPVVTDAVARYRDLYQPTAYRAAPGATVDLAPLVTRTLADPDSKGWILKGPDIDLRNLKTGVTRLGAYTFDVRGAVMLRGSRPAAKDLPERATVPVNRRADALAFLHTTGWPGALAREVIGHYEVAYADGTTLNVPLEYGRNIRAWTDTVTSSMILAPGFAGQTRDGLSVNVPVLEWPNPRPDAVITSVTLVSDGKNANPALLGLTVIGDRP
ncbi:hypothetical protein HNQ07_000867 [Deinococcus metalli]|uniref:Beta-hexosaminidase bacterial type N-terminal domain-containing protein n=1 Tax=Deinococcus metalli TaxID=1141878 RepID=A0A7W8NQ34_9DEIO|nr:beta-N-acetylhexosaminidase [Deinococcus metalli]MBB5375423.1 hypothetical protein [Deinococcus metalli]GHF29398.1 hypothetical protein GCM10017781_01720 [Deinococcus metalli]